MGILTRVAVFGERFGIIAPDFARAKILIGGIIKHIFENPLTRYRFQIGEQESEERIRRERSKSKLTFNVNGKIGEVFVVSAQAKYRSEDAGNALMGFGAPNLIEEEAALIPDPLHAKGMRMLGGHKDNFLVKIGNPFKRNHFLKSYRNPKYHKVLIDYKQGIKEGRITAEFIEEMKDNPFFGILYECKFPPADTIDTLGYSSILSEADIERALVEENQLFGELRLGYDVAGGGSNYSVIVLRGDNGAQVLYRENNPDTMSFTGIILRKIKEYNINPENVFGDVVGIGKGVYDRLIEQMNGINGVNVGEKPENEEDFINLRAQAYWRMADWIKQGAKLVNHSSWNELLSIKYKIQSDRRMKIISKEDLLKQGIMSPDVADALMLTFTRERKTFQPLIYKTRIIGIGSNIKK